MRRLLAWTLAVVPAVVLSAGCSRKEKLVEVANIRLDQDDPEASLALALKGMAQLQLEMSPGQRYLLKDYRERAANNFQGFLVCGDALAMMGDVHGAALSYWAAANYMRRIPFSPVAKGKNMRFAYEKLRGLYQSNGLTDSLHLVKANLALAGVYSNSAVVANLEANYQRAWDREQELIRQKKVAQAKVAAATVQVTLAAFDRSANAAYNRQRAQKALNEALGELRRATAALEAAKVPAEPESFALIRDGNYPATMSMHFFNSFSPNQPANTAAVANVLGAAGGPAANAVANAAANRNVNAMISNFAQLEQQTYMQEAAR